jgi:polyisoprenoid-binding protein YceI
MPSKLLQWIGVASVLALVGVGVGALLVVKDRVRIEIQSDTTQPGPDPLALLRDDVQVLQRELSELRSSLGSNFERLGNALEERATARHTELQAMARDLTQHLQADAVTGRTLANLQAQLDGVDRTLVAIQHGGSQTAQATNPGKVEVPPADPVAQAPEQAQEPAPEPAGARTSETPAQPERPAAPLATPARKTGAFLSFSVPETKFQFDQPQTYVLVSDLCRVGFDAKSTLHDFTGVTGRVTGRFTADFDDPAGAWQGEVACEAGTLTTGVDGRDSNMWEYLDTAHNAQIRFVIARFEPVQVDVANKTAKGTIHGQMSIRGKTRDIQMPVTIAVDASQRVQIEGQMPLKLSDYEVQVPSQLGGTITMQDEVKVWIALRARVQVGASK